MGFAGLWVCLRTVRFCLVVCECMFVNFRVCWCLCVDVFVLGLCVSGLCVWCVVCARVSVCLCVCVSVCLCVCMQALLAAPDSSR